MSAASGLPPQELPPAELQAKLAFSRIADVAPDAERAGVLRARTRPLDVDPESVLDTRSCRLRDCLAAGRTPPDLESMGFATIDLSANPALQRVLAKIREENRVSEASASALRRSLRGSTFSLASGKRLRLLFIASEGLIFRKAGPNGLKVDPHEEPDATNGHVAAAAVHGDQDVYGTPLRQILRGAAPFLFRHDTPDGRNRLSPLFLLNLWIPLQQITRPLVLMDRRSLDKRRHQLRYALPVTSFLERDEQQSLNDIWTYLHDPGQEWYFHAEMDTRRGYVFDTLGAAHGAAVLPGEDALEELYRRLATARAAIAAGDAGALAAATAGRALPVPAETTAPIRAAHERMTRLLEEARARAADPHGNGRDWSERASAALDRVVRRSVELRTIALLLPAWWPGSRPR